ncbi:Uncharacterised protein [Halioglobus japonicus]|nr:Uncharacterised protein [Halioglobus japonicus]
MDIAQVSREIKSAFSGVALGSGIGLWEAQAIDDYQTKEIQKKEREKDEKDDWSLLEPSLLQRCHSSLSFFDADGMRFHLPAFILASLEGEVDDPIFQLTLLDDYGLSRFVTLTDDQRDAIVTYLTWCLENDEYKFERPNIENSLVEYWKRQSNK